MIESMTLTDDKKLITKVVASLCDVYTSRDGIARRACILLKEKHSIDVETSAHWNDFLCEALDKYAD